MRSDGRWCEVRGTLNFELWAAQLSGNLAPLTALGDARPGSSRSDRRCCPQYALQCCLLRARDDAVERNYGEACSPPGSSRIVVVVVSFCALQLRYSPPVDDIASTCISLAEFPNLLLLPHVQVAVVLANLERHACKTFCVYLGRLRRAKITPWNRLGIRASRVIRCGSNDIKTSNTANHTAHQHSPFSFSVRYSVVRPYVLYQMWRGSIRTVHVNTQIGCSVQRISPPWVALWFL